MTKKKAQFLDEIPLHMWRYLGLLRRNPEYQYYILFSVLYQATFYHCINPWFILASLIECFLIGFLATASVLRKVDRAFQSLPISFESAGYGKPYWVIDSKSPLNSESYKIHAAGFSEKDFEQHRDIIASRLRMPVSSIKKPSADDPHIYVSVKKLEIPSHVAYSKLDLGALENGEFYLGQGELGTRKISLAGMIHMLVAGQTGSGKTQFIKQVLTTLLSRTKNIHVCLIDMKGGIDFQEFMDLKNVEFATNYKSACKLLDGLNALYEERTKIILEQKKTKWAEVTANKIIESEDRKGQPTGPVVLFVDEVAELSKKATMSAAHSELQEKIATLARLARVTGIHLILGTQRPDVKVIAAQSKDNLQTKVCFSVPNVSASTIVVGNMTASTLGGHPGRAVVVDHGMTIMQTPYISRDEVDSRLEPIRKRQEGQNTLITVTKIEAKPEPTKAEERSAPDDAKSSAGNDKPF